MTKQRDDLGTRMKSYYEEIPKVKLYRRMPVIVRLQMANRSTVSLEDLGNHLMKY